MPRTSGLFWSAVFAFLAMPALVAFALPWAIAPHDRSFNPIAVPVGIVGVVLLLWCVRDFYVAGRGTLAPWAPPKNLVVVGLYRVSRNPMYLAVLTILVAWSIAFGSAPLWTYAGLLAIAFYIRVVLFEEPQLAQTFGADWTAYRARVPRWIWLR